MNKNDIMQYAIRTIYEVSNNSDIYMSGILLNDSEAQMQLEKLAHIQAVIMQSLQVNNQKRAFRYIMAFYSLSSNNVLLEDRLRESITTKLITNV